MIVLTVAFVVAIAAMVLVHYLLQRRLLVADEGRQVALYKQHKKAMQDVARATAIVERLADQSRHMHDDARLMHQRVDGFFGDERVRVFLDQGVSGREPAHEEASHGG